MTRSSAVLLQVTLTIFSFALLVNCNNPEKADDNPNVWRAPENARDLKNPFRDDTSAIAKGRELYKLHCWQCHGESGYGDGAAGGALGAQPANFHSNRVRRQADGELFWKLANGRGNMPPFKDVLKDEERWELITYIRKMSDREYRLSPPQALRPDISVEKVMETDSLAVRILQNPITKDVYYTTFDGNVFQVRNFNTKNAISKKILTVKDHGITRLQGAEFVKNQLFLSGNVDDTAKKATGGRMVKFETDTAGAHNMTVVFNTVMYGTNKTIYDHGWNALAASPDGKYIYVNSGARTDHGEVQDNGGLYPGARDNALTSKVFRFPTDAKDLMLTDDIALLKQKGYIYSEGIRNAYDMAFDPSGNLFAVSNSSDYDNPEDMFWIRQNHHYGFPWVMGGIENPQQYKDWQPDPKTDKFINEFSHSWRVKYFHTDSTFPQIPDSVKFTPGVQNLGPDANEYRGHSGKVIDGDLTGIPVSTFTPHSSPLGLFFDNKKVLSDEFRGDGFVIRYTLGARGNMMRQFTMQGSDLLHLELTYDAATDNYFVRTTRIADSFVEPVDAIMIGSDVFVIEYGGKKGNIWKISLPTNSKKTSK
ncbi:MAG: c-type cytochrome [Chitinophagaceae bacterium]|nr:c-type cytochrome [Chitinophagaceae bacterium]